MPERFLVELGTGRWGCLKRLLGTPIASVVGALRNQGETATNLASADRKIFGARLLEESDLVGLWELFEQPRGLRIADEMLVEGLSGGSTG